MRFALVLVIFVVLQPWTDGQKIKPTTLRNMYRHASFSKIQSLVSNMNNKDKNVAARKTRLINWHKNNFGKVVQKTWSLWDNKTYTLERALAYLDAKNNFNQLAYKTLRPKLNKLLGTSKTNTLLGMLWALEEDHNGVQFDSAWADLGYFGTQLITNEDKKTQFTTIVGDVKWDNYDKLDFWLKDTQFMDDYSTRIGWGSVGGGLGK